MKNTLFILWLFYFLAGCTTNNLTHQETVTNYYKARDAVNYSEIKSYLSDSLTISEGDYVMPYNQVTFYESFKWDSIFQPSYKVTEIEEKDNEIIVSVALNSVRNEFLRNSTMTCQYKISFASDKISKIESLECKDVDWKIWQKERDALVIWIRENHPQLDGFIHDMTMKGAINYTKAMELYKLDKSVLKH